MSAQLRTEKFLVEQLKNRPEVAGLAVLAGLSSEKRPDRYIAVVTKSEDRRGRGVYVLEMRVAVVGNLSDPGMDEWIRETTDKVEPLLDKGSPFIGVQDGMRIHAITLLGSRTVRKERAVAQHIECEVAVQLYVG